MLFGLCSRRKLLPEPENQVAKGIRSPTIVRFLERLMQNATTFVPMSVSI